MGKNKNHAILRSTCFLLIATCAAISFAGLAACQSSGTQSAETDKDSCTSWPEGVYATAVAHDDGSQTFTVNGVTFKMVRVDGGTFAMGATPEQENDCWDNEKPVHNVTLSSFEMGETEVTQALWKAVMGHNPSFHKGDSLPVEQVSWNECMTFIARLNKLTGQLFRLPTEAEWEYAARGGNKNKGHKYSGSDSLPTVAFYGKNSKGHTHNVASLKPNELGLYDMSGNVWEWCSDWFGAYPQHAQSNPQGPSNGSNRALRGGSWYSIPRYCRVSNRYRNNPDVKYDYYRGLRLALDNGNTRNNPTTSNHK